MGESEWTEKFKIAFDELVNLAAEATHEESRALYAVARFEIRQILQLGAERAILRGSRENDRG